MSRLKSFRCKTGQPGWRYVDCSAFGISEWSRARAAGTNPPLEGEGRERRQVYAACVNLSACERGGVNDVAPKNDQSISSRHGKRHSRQRYRCRGKLWRHLRGLPVPTRSEERRVGKEVRSRG